MTVILVSVICLLFISSHSNSVTQWFSQLHILCHHCRIIKRNKAIWICKYSSATVGEGTRCFRSEKEEFCYTGLKLQGRFYLWNFLRSLKSPMKTWKGWASWHVTYAMPIWVPENRPFLNLWFLKSIRNTHSFPETRVLIKWGFF